MRDARLRSRRMRMERRPESDAIRRFLVIFNNAFLYYVEAKTRLQLFIKSMVFEM